MLRVPRVSTGRGSSLGRLAPWLVAVLFGCMACGSDTSEDTPPIQFAAARRVPPSTAGAESCIDCHGELVESWSETGMARTLGPVPVGELDGLGVVSNAPSGFHYQFLVTPGRTSHVLAETRPDTPGYVLATGVSFGIGSGTLDRSYVVQHGSQWWFAPLEVLSSPAGRHAVLAPGHMIQPGSRLATPITPECLGCHTDAPPPADFPLNNVADPARWQPRGISCAACHGSVEAHALWQEADLSGEALETLDPVLKPSELSRVQRLSICAACHLQGDARIVLDPDQLGPPRPGGDLLESRALFVAERPTEEVGFVSQVERLTLSRCFLETEMTCETCHDPHQSLYGGESGQRERERVRGSCARCHGVSAHGCSRDSSAGMQETRDCATCHLPLVGTFDVATVRIHDHYIRRRPESLGEEGAGHSTDGLRFAESAEGDWRRFTWPGAAAAAHVDDPGLWMMAFAGQRHGQRALELVDVTPGPTARALPMYHHVRGSLLENVGRTEDAIASYRQALAIDPRLAPSTINLGGLLGKTGLVDEGIALLSGLLQRHPQADGALRNRAALRLGKGDVQGFREDLQAAFQHAPSAGLAEGLARFHAGRGEHADARRWQELARQLDPRR